MVRLAALDDVLFPVEEHPVFVSFKEDGGSQHLPVPAKKAIVNRANRRVLGIVSRDYRLVSNREALEMAHDCCRTVFPDTKTSEWTVTTTDAPQTAGYCHIDLVHNSAALDFAFVPAADRPEAFGPFIRVTNSYNGLRALGFDIGFQRKICKNGLIVPDTIIRFKFTHMRRDIGEKVQFQIAQDKLTQFRTAFIDALAGLRNCTVPRPQFEALVRGVLLIRQPKHLEPETALAADWQTLSDTIATMSTRYATELGENAYATFNVITELASRPPSNRCLHRDRHSLQCLAGAWLAEFKVELAKPGFRLEPYLQKLTDDLQTASAKTEVGRPGARRQETT